jgi:YD repeat-containing protein
LYRYFASTGQITEYSYLTDGKLDQQKRTKTILDGSGINVIVSEAYVYSYIASGGNAGLTSSVAIKRQYGASGTWETIRQASYTYYDGTESYGNLGDLKKVVISDANNNALNTEYYRYYVPSEANGYTHGLKYFFSGDSYKRLAGAYANPEAATNTQAAIYADNYFEYDANTVNGVLKPRVTLEKVQGAGCSSCSNGLGQYTFSYFSSPHGRDYNSWTRKTIETLPDLTQHIVYTNDYGQVMLDLYKDNTSNMSWGTFYRYDAEGRMVFSATNNVLKKDSAGRLVQYDESKPDLINMQTNGTSQYLNASAGVVTWYTFSPATTATTTVAGAVAGYLSNVSLSIGLAGSKAKQLDKSYFLRTNNVINTYPVAKETTYRNTDGTGATTTSYSYLWSPTALQPDAIKVTYPVVPRSQYGPGVATTSTTYLDQQGRVTWQRDSELPQGFISYTSYDPVTGTVVKTIQDVDTTKTADFVNLPNTWVTPSGGGLHLISSVNVDPLGRPVRMVTPSKQVSYITYDDINDEVRTYAGWITQGSPTTDTRSVILPTTVIRTDFAHLYSESLQMTATPTLVNGQPTGTEPISQVISLTRSHMNTAGQEQYVDQYNSISALTYTNLASLGTKDVHFARTEYGYDTRGRLSRVVSPSGTVSRTVYDALGRPVTSWLGTNDIPSSGFWSPTNPR